MWVEALLSWALPSDALYPKIGVPSKVDPKPRYSSHSVLFRDSASILTFVRCSQFDMKGLLALSYMFGTGFQH